MMKSQPDIYDKIKQFRVVPVVAADSAEWALPLADALIAGGLPVAEITFRTAAAADVIGVLAKRRPELLVGAGTVLSADDLRRAKDCGARFAVAPGLNVNVGRMAIELGLPFMPGVMTPSDIEAALSLGLTRMKFFPAEAAGGVAMLKSIYAPYRHLGIRFVPTGGINAENMLTYLRLEAVLAVGGTWIADRSDIAAGNWGKVTDNCRHVRDLLSASSG
jgi:2-dehydro-3-deoxyphosphogluconate aldolase/(4S)-4-hydroxy-2-oxoglutarate aldolase